MKVLTVVIPAYNTERFIKRCLDSLLETEYKNMTELLIVNDGSKDSSGEIAEEYAANYPGIVSVIHKENGGHGSAINTGIKNATGKYFKVLDSDDWVDTENYNRFLERLQELDCDLVATPFICMYQKDGETLRGQVRGIEGRTGLESGKVLDFKAYADKLHVRMHQWTIRTEILHANNITLTEHSYYVDMQYILYPVPWLQSFCILDEPVYCYRLGDEGQSVAVKNMQKNREQHKNVLCLLVDFYKKRMAAQDEKSVLAYIARGIAKMQADEVQIALSMPIGKASKAELKAQEKYLKQACPAAYKANEKFSMKLLRRSGYLLYPVAAWMWRMVKK